MFKALISFAVFLICFVSNAQSNSGFITPDMAFSTELFPEKKKDIAFLNQLPQPKSMTVVPSLTSSQPVLPNNYNIGKEINRDRQLKRAAVVPFSSDPLGRSPLPDAGRDAIEQLQMRNMTTH